MKWREAIPALMGLLIIALFTANYLQNNQSLQMMDGRFARLDDRFARLDDRFVRLDEKIVHLDEKIDRLDEKWHIRHEKTMSIITDMQIDIAAMNTNIRHLQETVSRIDKNYGER